MPTKELAEWFAHKAGVQLHLRATGWTAAACVWCLMVGSVGVWGRGLTGDLAIVALVAIALRIGRSIQQATRTREPIVPGVAPAPARHV